MGYKYNIHGFISIIMCLINTQPSTTISTHHVRAISPSDYGGPNSQMPPDKLRWEIGLREATYQALRRERITQIHLKDEIYSAPILGYQDSATPFGDIAVLARGQLYTTPLGYKFVQDVYKNDCDDCHNKPFRCEHQQCSPYRDQNSKSLMALWTVKRIRHRDPKLGHRYELQFTVSPMSPAANAEFVTRNGNFDYNIPGHVFIIKVKNPGHAHMQHRNTYERSEKYKGDTTNSNIHTPPYWLHHSGDTFNPPTHANLNEFTPNTVNFHTGQYYTPTIKYKKPELDPNHTAYLISIANDYKPTTTETTPSLYERPYVTKHYFTKTNERLQNEPVKHYHHHFYIPEVSDIDLDKIERPILPQITTKNAHQYITSIKPVLTSDSAQNFILTTGVNRQVITQPTQRIPPLTTDQGYTYGTTYKYQDTTLPIPVQPIIFRQPTKYNPLPTYNTVPTNPQTIYKIISIPAPTQPTPFNPSPYYVRYSDPDPTYNNNEPPTVPGYITQPINPTAETTRTTYVAHTSPATSTLHQYYQQTELPTTAPSVTRRKGIRNKYPDSINVQLPPPKSGTDTTIPYVSSTVVSIVSQPAPTRVIHSESETAITKVQVNKPIKEDSETTTLVLEKHLESTTHKEEEKTEHVPTTSVTSIIKPTYITRTTEITTTFENEENAYTTTTITPTIYNNDVTTTESITTTRRSFGKPYKYRPSYFDDLDIFASNKTDITTKKPPVKTTGKEVTTNEEIFSTTTTANYTTIPSTTEITIKNTRVNKYLKNNRNRNNNFNKYNRNYNSKRLRARNYTRPIEIKTNDVETKTSQSLITSISFKVNKNNRRNYTDFSRPAIIPTNTDKPQRVRMHQVNKDQKDFNVFKAELPETTTSTQNTKAFDDIAQTLVNHARVVTYLDTKTTTPSNAHK